MASAFPALRTPRPLARWLAGKSPGERRIVAAVAAIAAIVLLWSAVWQPLTRDAGAMRAERAADAERLAAARGMVDESAALARGSAPQPLSDAHAELDRLLAQHGIKGSVTQLSWQDSGARVTFAAIRFDRLIVALEALQREAHLRVVEAMIAARVEPGLVRAEVTLSR